MRRRIGVLASVGLAAVVTVVPRTTSAGTPVYTAAAVASSPATRHAASSFSPFDLFGNHPKTTATTDAVDERIFEDRATRGGGRTTTTTSPPTTAAPPTTSTTVRPRPPSTTSTTARPRPPSTTSTTARPRPTTTTTSPPAAAPTSDYQPYPECMQHGHFDAFNADAGLSSPRADEMRRCWTPLVMRWSWPSVYKVFHVMWCESKGDPYAGPYHPYHGLMQIGPGGPFDPYQNMAAAWSKSSGGTTWTQWSCT